MLAGRNSHHLAAFWPIFSTELGFNGGICAEKSGELYGKRQWAVYTTLHHLTSLSALGDLWSASGWFQLYRLRGINMAYESFT